MGTTVPPQRPPGPASLPAQQRRQHTGQPGPQAGRRPGEQVIQPGGGPPEPLVAVVVVADHRVQGVGGPVGGHPGRPGQRPPQQWPDHRIGGVLGHRLHRRPAQLRPVQPRRIAPNQRRGKLPGRLQVAVPHCSGHLAADLGQRPPTHRSPGHQGQQQHPSGRATSQCPVGHSHGHHSAADQHHHIRHPRRP
jgi:hypothetical protein